VEEAKGKALVIVGAGCNSTAGAVEKTRIAKELGADVALIVTPYYNKPTQAGIIAHFEQIVNNVKIPLIVYNIKSRACTNIETSTMEALSSLPGVIGVKEASCDINQVGDVIHRVQMQREEFSVLSGDDALTLPIISLGGKGLISVASNLVPQKVVSMVDSALKGDFTEARQKYYDLLPLFRAAFIETNPEPIKAAMNLCGMAAGGCRLPLCNLKEESEKKLIEVLNKMELLD